ncbi:MAG TPA: type IV secretion system protein [Candidatus Angelobacter sp.]|nr:type IV secretion system protein [Candidatus Angelobacter sp.]
MDPTLLNNLLASLRDTIFNVLTQNGTPFAQLGLNIFRTITLVMIVIAGARIAFSDDHSLHKLRALAGLILIVWIMLTLYTRSSPLLGGYSFSEAIPKTAFGMADLVGTTTQQQMLVKLNQIISGLSDMSSFSLLHVRDFVTYLIITLLIALLELAMFIVVGFGYLALAAVLVIGPVLIPFMLVPKLDFLFWSWLKAVIKYSFYPVIGNIVLMGICQIMLSVLNTTLAPTGEIVITVTQIPILIIVFAAGLYATFKIPSLVQDIFSGTASAGSGIQAAITGAVMKGLAL